MEKHTVSRLIGAPPGYVGFDQGGLLTDGVDQHPHCVLLLDELTTFLDGNDQRNVLRCVRSLVDASSLSSSKQQKEEDVARGPEAGCSLDNRYLGAPPLDNPVTALWVTHRLEELQYADGVSFMDGGRIVWTGSPENAEKTMRALGASV